MKQKKKQRYRIRNWKEYNAALRQRGSLTFWVDEEAMSGWKNVTLSGRRGASQTYSDSAIRCVLMMQSVYHLPLRGMVGMLESLFGLMQVGLPVPDPSTLCRRRQQISVDLLASLPQGALHLVVDSSGFKVYGEGEWKVRQHGWSKRRTWRKLHLGINPATGEIVSATVSTNGFRDDEMLGELLSQIPAEIEIKQVSGDGIYDSRQCYELIDGRQARATIPPRHGARLSDKPELGQLNANIERIRELTEQGKERGDDECDGRKAWKEEVGYHQRSLVETSFNRLKTIFGDRLTARDFPAQGTELLLRCAALNRMTQLGMPQSYPI